MEGLADDGSPSVYYHTDSTRELSATIGDVLYKIQDLEVGESIVKLTLIISSPACFIIGILETSCF